MASIQHPCEQIGWVEQHVMWRVQWLAMCSDCITSGLLCVNRERSMSRYTGSNLKTQESQIHFQNKISQLTNTIIFVDVIFVRCEVATVSGWGLNV